MDTETGASLVCLSCAAAGRTAAAAWLLAKSSLMPEVAGETVASEEMGTSGGAVAVAGKGYILSP